MPVYSYDYNGMISEVNKVEDVGWIFLKINTIINSIDGSELNFNSPIVIKIVNSNSYTKTIYDSINIGDFVLFSNGKLSNLINKSQLIKTNETETVKVIDLEKVKEEEYPFFSVGIDTNEKFQYDFIKYCFPINLYKSFTDTKINTICHFITNLFNNVNIPSMKKEFFKWKVARESDNYKTNGQFIKNINYLCCLYLKYMLSDTYDIDYIINLMFNPRFIFTINKWYDDNTDVKPVTRPVTNLFLSTLSKLSTKYSKTKTFPILTEKNIEIILIQWFQINIVRCFNVLGITTDEFKDLLINNHFLRGDGLTMSNDRKSEITICDYCNTDLENEKNESRHLIEYQLVDWCGICAKGNKSGDFIPPISSLFSTVPKHTVALDLGIGSTISHNTISNGNIFEHIIKAILKNPFVFKSIPVSKASKIFLSSHPLYYSIKPPTSIIYTKLKRCSSILNKINSTDIKSAGLVITSDKSHKPIKDFIEENKNILTRVFGIKIIDNTVYDYDRFKINKIINLFINNINESNLIPIDYSNDTKYSDEQNNVINHAVSMVKSIDKHNIMAITGGPGVGKSTILKGILEQFKNLGLYNKIRITSFTGKAVARIKEVTNCTDDNIICTLDRLIAKKDMNFDCIIIDEASMINSELLFRLIITREISNINTDIKKDQFINKHHKYSYLISRLLSGKITFSPLKIILIGDKDQLPPIQWGAVFNDIIEGIKYPNIKVFKLTKNFRSDGSLGLIDFFNLLNIKQLNLFTNADTVDLKSNIVQSRWLEVIISKIEEICKNNNYDLIKFPELIGIACAYNVHVDSLNHFIREYYFNKNNFDMDKRCGKFSLGDRVMLTQNLYYYIFNENDKKLVTNSNGDMGYVTNINNNIIEVKFDAYKEIVKFSPTKHNYKKDEMILDGDTIVDSNYLVYGYALTVHKMQGSEYNHIIFTCPTPNLNNNNFLSKSLAYTAVTRAKKTVTVISEKDVKSVLSLYC